MMKGTEESKTENKNDKLKEILIELDSVVDIEGSVVISTEGLIISSNISENFDEETVAAMTAAMQGAAETTVSELKKGKLNEVIVDSSEGKIITISAGAKAILVILAKRQINLGLILLELGKTAGKISDILSG